MYMYLTVLTRNEKLGMVFDFSFLSLNAVVDKLVLKEGFTRKITDTPNGNVYKS